MACTFQICVLIFAITNLCCAQIQPLVFPPSGQWDGVDGPWSTFDLGLGDPIQRLTCVPGISSPVVMLPIDSPNCNQNSNDACRNRTTYDRLKSQSWKSRWNETGLYNIPTTSTRDDIFPDSTKQGAIWGSENVFVGHNAIQDVEVARQYVLGVPSPSFFVSILGLALGDRSPNVNVTTQPTLLLALFDAGRVPSHSFSYTAGSARIQSTGSLILGGYDTSRFDAKSTISIPMPGKQNNTLLVYLQSVSITGANSATWQNGPGAGYFRIDSALPQIVLPLEACEMFEKAFNLSWSDTLQLYIIDKLTRSRLRQEDAKVHFTIAAGPRGEGKVFTFPYRAFDLQLSPPLVNSTTYYFPLKRATSPSQYVLGRAFLQETHLIVDYDRANFSVSQAYSSGGTGTTGQIVPIHDVTYVLLSGSGASPRPSSSSLSNALSPGLSTGAYAGIGVGLCFLGILVAGLLLSWKKKWLFFRKNGQATPGSIGKAELHAVDITMDIPRVEAMGKEHAELETVERKHEVVGTVLLAIEGHDVVHELGGGEMRRSGSVARAAT